jgi:hypothetical protein
MPEGSDIYVMGKANWLFRGPFSLIAAALLQPLQKNCSSAIVDCKTALI